MTEMASNIVITSVGAITPVGKNAAMTMAAIKAGISQISEHVYFECVPDDPEWDEELPLFVSTVPLIDPFLDGRERLIQLALPAVTEAMEKARFKRQYLAETGFMLSLPQMDKVTDALGLREQLLPELFKRTGLTTFKLWKTTQSGHTGVFSLIQNAAGKLLSGDIKYCLVGGVESYLLEDRLEYLDENWRIRSDRNVDGFIPGESAVMLMLETEENARARQAPILARIGAIGEGLEPETITSKKNSTGKGLTDAVTSVVPEGSPLRFEDVYCSLNGESYYAFEWGLLVTRMNRVFADMKNLHHPAENCGDLGAATGGLLILSAMHNLNSEDSKVPQSLLWTSSDNGNRMALTLFKGEG